MNVKSNLRECGSGSDGSDRIHDGIRIAPRSKFEQSCCLWAQWKFEWDMSFKRIRQDGQVTRGEYELDGSAQSSGPGTFSRASIGTLHGRRMVSARHIDKRQEYVKHAKALNSTFCKWFNDQISANPGACLSTGAQNWLDYRDKLEERFVNVCVCVCVCVSCVSCVSCVLCVLYVSYHVHLTPTGSLSLSLFPSFHPSIARTTLHRYLRVHGEVLTWGSGDCGQLAHGTEDEADLSVKVYIYSRLALMSLRELVHSYTSQPHIYTTAP